MCGSCTGGTLSDCTTCNPANTLTVVGALPLTCVTSCPNFYFNDGIGSCRQCSALCATCNGTGVTDCVTCRSGNVKMLDGSCFNLCGNN